MKFLLRGSELGKCIKLESCHLEISGKVMRTVYGRSVHMQRSNMLAKLCSK
jgi:hypothetical protein